MALYLLVDYLGLPIFGVGLVGGSSGARLAQYSHHKRSGSDIIGLLDNHHRAFQRQCQALAGTETAHRRAVLFVVAPLGEYVLHTERLPPSRNQFHLAAPQVNDYINTSEYSQNSPTGSVGRTVLTIFFR